MKQIDKLLRRAKQLEPALFPTISTLQEVGKSFLLTCALWDGKTCGRTEDIESTHKTVESARDEYRAFLKRYPRSNRYDPVLLDTVIGGDVFEQTASAPVNTEGSSGGTDESDK